MNREASTSCLSASGLSVIFAFNHFDTGGLQTLMIRQGSWIQSNGGRSLLVVDKIDSNMRRQLDSNCLEYVETWDSDKIASLLEEETLRTSGLVYLMSYELLDFLKLEKILFDNGLKGCFKHIFYSVYPGTTRIASQAGGVVGEFVRSFYGKVVQQCLTNRQMLFMDADCRDAAREMHHLESELFSNTILPLGMNITECSAVRRIEDIECRTILTVSRAIFPFKGYLVGLLHTFAEMVSDYQDLRLKIVSFGPHIDVLKNEIKALDDEAKKKVELIEGASEESIRTMLQQTWLYIGMGTTVLNAANEGVPSIVIYHHTMDCKACGYFSDDPLTIGLQWKDGANDEDVSRLIEACIELDDEAYSSLCAVTRAALAENYSIDNVMSRCLSCFEGVGDFRLSRRDWAFVKLLDCVRGLRRKMLDLD